MLHLSDLPRSRQGPLPPPLPSPLVPLLLIDIYHCSRSSSPLWESPLEEPLLCNGNPRQTRQQEICGGFRPAGGLTDGRRSAPACTTLRPGSRSVTNSLTVLESEHHDGCVQNAEYVCRGERKLRISGFTNVIGLGTRPLRSVRAVEAELAADQVHVYKHREPKSVVLPCLEHAHRT